MIGPFSKANIDMLRPKVAGNLNRSASFSPSSPFSTANIDMLRPAASNPAPYRLHQFGVPAVTDRNSYGPFDPVNVDMLRPSNRRDVGNAATYGINPDIIAGSEKSQWELDDDTRDFLTDAFNTLNQEDEYLGGGGSGGGGSGGGGGSFQGGPGSEHSTTWKFGGSRFKPQGIF